MLSEIEVVGIRIPPAARPVYPCLFNEHDSRRLVDRQRPEEERVGQAHDGARQSQAKRQRGDRRGREAGRLPHPPKRHAHVLQEMLERRHALLIPIVLLERLPGSERDEGAAPRLGWRQPPAQVRFRFERDVVVDFLAQPRVVVPPRHRRRQPNQPLPQPSHGRSFAFTAKNRSTSAVVCSHPRVSASSCFRPAFVSW